MDKIMELIFPAKRKYSFTRIKAITYIIFLIIAIIICTSIYPVVSEVSQLLAIIACIATVIFTVIVIGGSISTAIIASIKKRQF